MTGPFAAIDLGTNTARLLIGGISAQGQIQPLVQRSAISRLGGGFSRDRGLSSEARCRAVTILGEFARDISAHGVVAVRAVATSAVRDARNGHDFVREVYEKTGISLQVIAGDVEAQLNLQGVLSGLNDVGDLFVFDIGGGSTEYVLTRGKTLLFSMSLPLGVVRLTEGKGIVSTMDDKVSRELNRLRLALLENNFLEKLSGSTLIGTAGTVTTLAAMHRTVDYRDSSLLHGTALPLTAVKTLFKTVVALSPHDRLALPGLEKGREDLIVAGTLITLRTMELFGFEHCTVCETGVLQGALLSLQSDNNCANSEVLPTS
jgi:exopolyphosphatase / guanosine-5'-triphosphate,3'-diphosphate pyrophosphatase